MYRIVFFLPGSLLLMNCVEQQVTANLKLPYYNEPDFTSLFLNDNTVIANRITHIIGNFLFLNQDSNWISQKTVEGKIHVTNFIFTSCGSICPAMTRNMKIVSDSLQNEQDLVLLSYTVTPWKDKPYVLKQYKRDHETNNNYRHFLTGTKTAIIPWPGNLILRRRRLVLVKTAPNFYIRNILFWSTKPGGSGVFIMVH